MELNLARPQGLHASVPHSGHWAAQGSGAPCLSWLHWGPMCHLGSPNQVCRVGTCRCPPPNLDVCYQVREATGCLTPALRPSGKACLWHGKEIKGPPGWLGRNEQAEGRGLGSSESSLCDTLMVGTGLHTFVQIHRMYHTKTEPPRADYGLWAAVCVVWGCACGGGG